MNDPNARVRLEKRIAEQLAHIEEMAVQQAARFDLSAEEQAVEKASYETNAGITVNLRDLRSLLAELSPKPGEAEALIVIIDAEVVRQSQERRKSIFVNTQDLAQAILKERYSG